jgi:hypothetical protein
MKNLTDNPRIAITCIIKLDKKYNNMGKDTSFR